MRIEKIGEFHRLVKPCVYREMHHIISEVTHVNAEELEKTESSAVAEYFWNGAERILFLHLGKHGSYGVSAEHGLSWNGAAVSKPFLFYDVQKLYSLLYSDGESRESLDVAVDFLKCERMFPFTGRWRTRNILGGFLRA